MSPVRRIVVVLFAFAALAACTSGPKVPASVQLVEDAKHTLERIRVAPDAKDFQDLLPRAAGIAIFPAVYKAGFFVGAEAGNGLVIGRDADGNWGYPAFYVLGGGSFGLQIGAQQSAIVLVLRSRKALEAVIKHQGKLGPDAGVAVGWVGAGVEGATTSNLGLDIVGFATSRGLYGGVSLEGTALVRRNDYNTEFYGTGTTPEAIVLQNKYKNAKADSLRAALATK
jgi:lipid-binding SYLF domain-containing protein